MGADNSMLSAMERYIMWVRDIQLDDGISTVAEYCLADTIAAALFGWKNGLHRETLENLGAGDTGDNTIVAEPGGHSIYLSSLINAFLVTSSVMEDGSRHAGLHPSAGVIPAALTVAEANKCTGYDLLKAIVAGYEVMIRLGMAVNPVAVRKGFHITSVVAPLAAAAAVSLLMGYERRQVRAALTIAAPLGGGLLKSLLGHQAYPLQVARAAQGGVIAAVMAGSGMKGYDRVIEEGFLPTYADNGTPAVSETGWEGSFMIERIYRKPYPGCRHIHPSIDAALEARREFSFDIAQVENILVETYSVALATEIDSPSNRQEAYFSIPFAVSIALFFGDAAWERFGEASIHHPEVKRLMKRVQVRAGPEMDREYPEKRMSRIKILLSGGKSCVAQVGYALGEPERPLSAGSLKDKLAEALTGTPLEKRARWIEQKLLEARHMENVKELTELLRL